MTLRVRDLLGLIEHIAPSGLAESWDNVGLLVGSPDREVSGVVVGLDPTPDLLRKALSLAANVIVTHHPVIFHPLKQIHGNHPDGALLTQALTHDLNLIGCHTNLDSSPGGVSDVIASGLGLVDLCPLIPAGTAAAGTGLGRIGTLAEELDPAEFIARLRRVLDSPWILAAGSPPARIRRVAVCGGSCSDLASIARGLGAEVFVTAEVKHAVARWAEAAGLWLLDGGHFGTEHPAMRAFQRVLRAELGKAGHQIEVWALDQEPPLRLVDPSSL